jgi:hypothetical protein
MLMLLLSKNIEVNYHPTNRFYELKSFLTDAFLFLGKYLSITLKRHF